MESHGRLYQAAQRISFISRDLLKRTLDSIFGIDEPFDLKTHVSLAISSSQVETDIKSRPQDYYLGDSCYF